ncbi:Membrane protein involved in the export of O-antigen and teichoic acid [Williamsia serinedens]|uniref:Membrane protein involved in the export of O-antigen and teichoic acid n=1 Tax=Williamsia serinedens TaxID=391736 RepID=A0ABT1H3X0_9NOCA|nr:Membrane protein involved in the export of O-antigen and teichoic acid [Williamsia serinedens]
MVETRSSTKRTARKVTRIRDLLTGNGSATRKDVVLSATIKMATLPGTAIASIAGMHYLTNAYHTEALALYGLVLSIPLLLPFTDLGLGGAIAEIVASRRTFFRTQILEAIKKTLRRLFLIGTTMVAIGWLIAVGGRWSTVLNIDTSDTNLAAALAFSCVGAAVPTGVGYRILLGLQRNRFVVLLQSAAALTGAIAVLLFSLLRFPLWAIIPLPQLATLTFSVVGILFARKLLRSDIEIGVSVQTDTTPPAPRLGGLAIANLMIGLCLPLIYQCGRILTAHLSSVTQVAIVVAASQLFSPIVSVLQSGGQSLWPHFSALRGERRDAPALGAVLPVIATFAALGTAAGAILILVGPAVTRISTAGQAVPTTSTLIAYALAVLAVAVNLPVGMAMMGARAVRFQAATLALTALATVSLTAAMSPSLGATAVPLALALALTVLGTAPGLAFIFLNDQHPPSPQSAETSEYEAHGSRSEKIP